MDAAELRTRLRQVRWLGGGSGAGKSTIARALAARHGLHLCRTSNPPLALHKLLERDQLFTEYLHEETRMRGLHLVEVDTTTTVEELSGLVARALEIGEVARQGDREVRLLGST